MTSDAPVAEIVDEQTGEVHEERPAQAQDALTVFGRDEIGLERATRIANQLDSIIREKGLAVQIGPSKHIKVEAWCAVASMVGVAPQTAWTKAIRDEGTMEVCGFRSRVEVRRLATGDIIGAAEASCYADEVQKKRDGTYLHRWVDYCPRYDSPPTSPCKQRPTLHAVESMAQTRATSKAIGQVLRWIPVLAGYSGTPAEEMPPSGDMSEEPDIPRRPTSHAAQRQRQERDDREISDKQGKLLWAKCYAKAEEIITLGYPTEEMGEAELEVAGTIMQWMDEHGLKDKRAVATFVRDGCKASLAYGKDDKIKASSMDAMIDAIERYPIPGQEPPEHDL
jgi:hypothetical protein